MMLSLEFFSKAGRAVALLTPVVSSFLTEEVKSQSFLMTSDLRLAAHKSCVLSLRLGVVGDTVYSFIVTCLTRGTCN